MRFKNPKINLFYSFFFGFKFINKFILLFFKNDDCQIISIYSKKIFYLFKKILNSK
jgi:hypothetical protein